MLFLKGLGIVRESEDHRRQDQTTQPEHDPIHETKPTMDHIVGQF